MATPEWTLPDRFAQLAKDVYGLVARNAEAGIPASFEDAEAARNLNEYDAWHHLGLYADEQARWAAGRFAESTDQPYGPLSERSGTSRTTLRKQLPNLAGRVSKRRALEAWLTAHSAEVLVHAERAVQAGLPAGAGDLSASGFRMMTTQLTTAMPADPAEEMQHVNRILDSGQYAAFAPDPGVALLWLAALACDRDAHEPKRPPADRGAPCYGQAGCPRRVQARVSPTDDPGDRCLEHAAEALREGKRIGYADPGIALTAMKIAFGGNPSPISTDERQ